MRQKLEQSKKMVETLYLTGEEHYACRRSTGLEIKIGEKAIQLVRHSWQAGCCEDYASHDRPLRYITVASIEDVKKAILQLKNTGKCEISNNATEFPEFPHEPSRDEQNYRWTYYGSLVLKINEGVLKAGKGIPDLDSKVEIYFSEGSEHYKKFWKFFGIE